MRWKLGLALLVILALLVSTIAVPPQTASGDMDVNATYPSEKTENTLYNEYEERDPIHIEGNENFSEKAEEEGWPGDGSEENPYIIEGYRIEGGDDNGIRIKDVDLSFKIRDNFIAPGKMG